MADKSQLSAEEIVSEIESLRQQMRSFAMQRAEGLIDASLQQDLVDNIKKRLAELDNQQSKPSEEPEHAEAQMVEEMVVADASDTETDEDTHEHPEVPPVQDTSDKPKRGEANVIDELFENGDTYEFPKVSPISKSSEEPEHAEAQMVEEMLVADTSDTEADEDTHEHPEVPPVQDTSDKPKHGEANVIDELFENGDTYEFPKVAPISKPSDEPEHAEADTVDELLDEDDPPEEETVASDEPEHAEAQRVQEMTPVGATDTKANEDAHEEPDVPPISEVSNEAEHADTNNIIIEEEVSPLRRDEDDSLTLGDFVEDVVVSSAMVKEPDYLDSIHEPNVVDIRDITKTYQMGELELEVLKGITLQVNQGELIAIMGPSGSGKSTLMNILGALDKPTDGAYFLDGVDVSKMNEKQLAETRNQKIGFVFQSFNLLKRTSAIRQVELPLIYGRHKNRTRLAREALEAVGLGQRLDHTPAELSGGQQQRVAIARALVTKPSLILADEPTGNLDSRSGSEVMQIFQSLNRKNNITTILVTHDIWIARHTDRVIMMRDGRIIADQRVKNPLVGGDAERPTETQELQAIFENTYYGGDEEEYT
jgi:putative ABC transport system ATP-binding protein